jgi:spore coat protein U-like protein
VKRTELLLAAALLAPGSAAAITTCSGSNVVLPFGPYDVLSPSPAQTQGDFVVTCSRVGGPQNTVLTVSIGPSATSGSVASRQMRHANGDRLAYNVFREAARISVWGQTAAVDTVARTISVPNNASATAAFTLFGRIPAQQDARIGAYTDSLVITVSY